MREQSFASPDDIDLAALWAKLRRAAPKLVVLALVTGALTYVVLSLMAPRYSSQAELAIVARGTANPFSNPNAQSPGLDTLPSRMDKEAVNTHIRALLSSNLAAKVAAELNLKAYPEFNPKLGSVDTLDAILRAVGLGGTRPGISEDDVVLNELFSRLDVFSPAESRVINIRFTSVDPDLAAKVANALAETYREELAQATVAETDTVQKSLGPKIEELGKEVSKADAEVASFRAKAGLLRGGAGQTPIGEQQLGEIASELTKANAAKTAARTRADAARELLAKGTPEVIPEVQASPVIQNLIQQRVTVDRDLLKLSATMKPAHPVIRQLRADLDAVKQQISAEVANVVAALEREASTAAEQEAAIRRTLDTIKTQVAEGGSSAVELRQLEAKAAAKRAELERLTAQFEANRARADGGIVPVEAQVITLARASSVPVFPRKVPYSILVMAGALLIGTAIVVTAGLAAGARRMSAEEMLLREDIALVAASSPPEPDPSTPPPGKRAPAELPTPPDPVPAFRSPVAFAAHLMHGASAAQTGLRTMLASAADAAATAAVARETAIAMRESGAHTLLIDASMDVPGLAAELRIAGSPGFAELVRGEAKFADVVRTLHGTDVHVIAAGHARRPLDPDAEADQLNMILDALDEAYDQILIVAKTEPARILFETIQGRVDRGVIVEESGAEPPFPAKAGTYLGYVVSDIELSRFAVEPELLGSAEPGTRGKGARSRVRVG